jgi:hypothetical protein
MMLPIQADDHLGKIPSFSDAKSYLRLCSKQTDTLEPMTKVTHRVAITCPKDLGD